MSHDLKSPMNVILGFADVAKKYLGDEQKVMECLDKIISSGKQLRLVLSEILDMSSIEGGMINVNEEAEDGKVAVDMMKDKGPDYYEAVLMDIQMPVMDCLLRDRKADKRFDKDRKCKALCYCNVRCEQS